MTNVIPFPRRYPLPGSMMPRARQAVRKPDIPPLRRPVIDWQQSDKPLVRPRFIFKNAPDGFKPAYGQKFQLTLWLSANPRAQAEWSFITELTFEGGGWVTDVLPCTIPAEVNYQYIVKPYTGG